MESAAKWKQFSEEELKMLIENSINMNDFFQKMGYKKYCSRTFQNILKLYPNLKPQKRLNSNRIYWKKYSKEEIFNKAKNSINQEDFLKQFGYTTCRPTIFKQIIKTYPELKETFPWSKEAKFKKYSFEELQKVAQQTRSGADFLKKLGYKNYCSETIKKIKEIYPDLTLPIQEENKCKWKNFSYEELQELSNNSTSKEDFYKKIGYALGENYSYSEIKKSILKEYPNFIFPEKIASKGEKRIKEILKNINISFEEQFSFSDLLGEKNNKPLFDFKLNINDKILLIEYQGEQHYQPINFFGEEEKFLYQKKNDERKRKYCKKNNIPLIEIPYWDFEILNENYIKEKINEYCN